MRLKVIAALRAPTIATINHRTCHHVGQPCTASIPPTKANGRAKIECSNLIISSVVWSLPVKPVAMPVGAGGSDSFWSVALMRQFL